MTLNALVAGRLLAAGLDPDDTERVIRGALDEDLRYGPDLTSAATAAPGVRAVAGVVAREPGVLAGLPVALAVLDAAGIPPAAAAPRCADGDRIGRGAEVLRIRAPLRELLAAAPHGVFLELAQSWGGLAGVSHRASGAGQGVDPGPGCGGDPGQVGEEVEQGPLGGEQLT